MSEWRRGDKHPETPGTVFKNLWEIDLLRRKLTNRCTICDITLSDNNYKEIAIDCKDGHCSCKNPPFGFKPHAICDACYSVFHSLYINYGIKDRNYFRNLDEKDKANKGDDSGRRKRMGLE